MKIALLSSTGASVAKMAHSFLEQGEGFDLVITDRECNAELFAAEFSLPCYRIEEKKADVFSDRLSNLLKSLQVDYLILFFTRLIKGEVLSEFEGRIINFHPSLLPACPGQKGFEDTMASQALFFGSTVHMVDAGMDTGQPIIQVHGRKHPNLDGTHYRHQVFAQQVASLYQLISWLRSNKFVKNGRSYYFKDANYQSFGIANPLWEAQAEQIYQKVFLGLS